MYNMSDSEYTVAPYGAEAESREATDLQEGAVPDNVVPSTHPAKNEPQA